jgi:hypothetical protein
MARFRFASTVVMSLALAALLGAQAPPPANPQTPAPPAASPQTPPAPAEQSTNNAAETTIVGCLAQSATASDAYTLTIAPASTADAVGAAGPGDNAGDAARAAGAAAPPSGAARAASRAPASTSAPATYTIVGIAADQLKAHVNHQVELKGRVSIASAAAAAAAVQSGSAAKEFRASSVKMLNATCPPAK